LQAKVAAENTIRAWTIGFLCSKRKCNFFNRSILLEQCIGTDQRQESLHTISVYLYTPQREKREGGAST